MKQKKGLYGYIAAEKKRRILITVGMFALPLLIFVTGLIQTKSRLNLFTVVAILGCLPACKSCVGMILICMQKSISQETYEKISSQTKDVEVLYELVLTTYEKNLKIDAMAVTAHQLIGYTSEKNIDTLKFEKYMKDILKNHNISVSVKIVKELPTFLQRTAQLKGSKQIETSPKKETSDEEIIAKIKSLLLAISL